MNAEVRTAFRQGITGLTPARRKGEVPRPNPEVPPAEPEAARIVVQVERNGLMPIGLVASWSKHRKYAGNGDLRQMAQRPDNRGWRLFLH